MIERCCDVILFNDYLYTLDGRYNRISNIRNIFCIHGGHFKTDLKHCSHELQYVDNIRDFITQIFGFFFRITTGKACYIYVYTYIFVTVYFYSGLLGQFGGKRDCYATAIKRSQGGEFPEGKIVLGETEPSVLNLIMM